VALYETAGERPGSWWVKGVLRIRGKAAVVGEGCFRGNKRLYDQDHHKKDVKKKLKGGRSLHSGRGLVPKTRGKRTLQKDEGGRDDSFSKPYTKGRGGVKGEWEIGVFWGGADIVSKGKKGQ